MKLLYDLFGQLYEGRVFSELIHESGYLSEGGIRNFYNYSLFLAISFSVIDARYSEFLIIDLLYYAQYYRSFLYLQYSGLFLESSQLYSTTGVPFTKQRYQISIIWYHSKTYTAGSAEDVYI